MNNPETKTQYFICSNEFEFDGSDDCMYLGEMCRVDQEGLAGSDGVRLSFGPDNKLIKKEYSSDYTFEKQWEEMALTEKEKAFTYQEFPIQVPGHFQEDPKGLHHLCGPVPDGFSVPILEGTLVTYLGMLSKDDPLFSWLGFDLHLVHPNFLGDGEPIHLDYSNPIAPVFINKEELEQDSFCDKEMMEGYSPIGIYDKMQIRALATNSTGAIVPEKFRKVKESMETGEGCFGVPHWDLNPFFPKCPKTGKSMKPLCFFSGVGVAMQTELPDDFEGNRDDLFYDNGMHQFFFNPESKVLTAVVSFS